MTIAPARFRLRREGPLQFAVTVIVADAIVLGIIIAIAWWFLR